MTKSTMASTCSSVIGHFDGHALGLLANLKETCKVKRACQVEATSITTVVKGVMVVIPTWKL
jgi:hypothetical protein